MRSANLALRFLLELGALAAFAYWGGTIQASALTREIAAIVLPLAVALFWAVFVSPKARFPTGLRGRAGLGLIVFLLASCALASRDHRGVAIVYGALGVLSTILLIVWRQ